jgi:hypothetical protein
MFQRLKKKLGGNQTDKETSGYSMNVHPVVKAQDRPVPPPHMPAVDPAPAPEADPRFEHPVDEQ